MKLWTKFLFIFLAATVQSFYNLRLQVHRPKLFDTQQDFGLHCQLIRATCCIENDISEDEWFRALTTKTVLDTEKCRKTLLCFAEGMGVFNQNGEIDWDVIEEYLIYRLRNKKNVWLVLLIRKLCQFSADEIPLYTNIEKRKREALFRLIRCYYKEIEQNRLIRSLDDAMKL